VFIGITEKKPDKRNDKNIPIVVWELASKQDVPAV
jgi:hypothetical protein